MQRVLTDGADKHETTNWLKRAGWTAHFKDRDLGEIYTIAGCRGGRRPVRSAKPGSALSSSGVDERRRLNLPRRAIVECPTIKVIPDSKRPSKERDRIKTFSESITSFNELPNVITKVIVLIGINSNTSNRLYLSIYSRHY
jgi:hypothetical protein